MNTIDNDFDFVEFRKLITNLIIESKQSIKQKPKKKFDTENDFPILKYIEELEDLLKIDTPEDFETYKEKSIQKMLGLS